MKHVKKRGCPHSYSRWCKAVQGSDKEEFAEIPFAEKRILLDALLKEQGAICAYTMKRISVKNAHVEHIKPQSAFPDPKNGAALRFDNLVACFPREGMKANYRYGAQQKADWWEEDGRAFVSPLDPSCEKRFLYLNDGDVTHIGAAAQNTIIVLGLAHPSLCEDRRRVLNEFIFGPSGQEPLPAAKAKQAIGAICQPNTNGHFFEFCLAIRDALIAHLKLLDKLAKKRKAIRRQN